GERMRRRFRDQDANAGRRSWLTGRSKRPCHGTSEDCEEPSSRRTSLPQGRQRLETHLARADAEPVDDFLVERDPVGAAMLDLFGLREPGIEDALLAR